MTSSYARAEKYSTPSIRPHPIGAREARPDPGRVAGVWRRPYEQVDGGCSRHWEATAVTELRAHAERLAAVFANKSRARGAL